MFALEVKQNPAGDASEVEKGNGDVRDYNIRSYTYSSSIVRVTRCTYFQSRASRSRCIPGTWYGTCKHPTDYRRVRGTGVFLARKNSLWAGTTSLRRVTSKATPSSCDGEDPRRRSAVSPWNMDALRSTTPLLRGIRSARGGIGQRSFRSSALH